MNMSSEHEQKKNIIISNQTSYLLIIVGWQGTHSKANTTWAQSTINPERTNQEKLSINLQSFQQETRQKCLGKRHLKRLGVFSSADLHHEALNLAFSASVYLDMMVSIYFIDIPEMQTKQMNSEFIHV